MPGGIKIAPPFWGQNTWNKSGSILGVGKGISPVENCHFNDSDDDKDCSFIVCVFPSQSNFAL